MSFVSIGFLFGLAALAIPVLIHLLNRWQIQQVELGTMRFLSEVIVENSSRRRIRRWLLLLTRLAIIALLAVLFARPFLSKTTPQATDFVRVILVDHSASMAMPGSDGRLIDDAIAAALAAASRAPEGSLTLIATFDASVQGVDDLSTIDRSPRSLNGPTNFEAAISWAHDKIVDAKAAKSDVVLISDFQQTGLLAKSEVGQVTLPSTTTIELIDVGRPAVQNLAITRLVTPAKSVPVGQEVRLDATLFNYGTFAAEEVEVVLTASAGKRTLRTKKSVNVPPQEALEVGFELGELGEGVWQITVIASSEDDLYLDNERRIAIEVATPLPILVVTSTDKGLDAESDYIAGPHSPRIFHLLTALQQSQYSNSALVRTQPSVLSLDENPTLPLQRAELTIVANAAELGDSQIEQLRQYVEQGGSLLMFARDAISAPTRKQLDIAQLSPGRLKAAQHAGAMPFRITQVSHRGDMMTPFRDAQTGDLSVLRFTSIQSSDVRKDTEVMAWFDDERPAITRHRIGEGQIVWFLAGADNESSNWATHRLFVPMLQQIVGDMLSLTGEGTVRYRTIGEASGKMNSTADSDPATRGDSGSRELRFEEPAFVVDDRVTFVVNPDSHESDPTKITKEKFLESFELVESGDEDTSVKTVQVNGREELWPWLAACLLMLLVAEFCLANRTSS